MKAERKTAMNKAKQKGNKEKTGWKKEKQAEREGETRNGTKNGRRKRRKKWEEEGKNTEEERGVSDIERRTKEKEEEMYGRQQIKGMKTWKQVTCELHRDAETTWYCTSTFQPAAFI